MKRLLSILAAVLCMVCLLTACSISTTQRDPEDKEPQSIQQAEAVLQALSGGDLEAAEALMHPGTAEDLTAAFNQVCRFLDGRKPVRMELQSFNVTTSVGTSGSARQEQTIYTVTLEDGDVFLVSAYYVTDGKGEGFGSYQVVLGVV